MLVSSSDCNIALVVHRVLSSEIGKTLKSAIANGSIAHCRVDHKVDKAVFGVSETSNDEST